MSIDSVPISNFISSRGVITESEYQNIYSACRIMHENSIGCVVILHCKAVAITIASHRNYQILVGGWYYNYSLKSDYRICISLVIMKLD